jgi:hypothetical protein
MSIPTTAPQTRKLGRLPAQHDARTLRLEKYIGTALPDPPQLTAWSRKATSPWGMMANDRIGDCTCAGAGHAVQSWTANRGVEQTIADAAIVTAYSAVSGYDPRTGANDNGAVMLDVLKYWRKTGIGGHKINAYAAIQPSNHRLVAQAAYLFGGLYAGVALPLAAEKQLDAGQPWTVPSRGRIGWDYQPGSWGGHAIYLPDYSVPAGLTCVTWGALQGMSWAWWDAYCDECYAILPLNDWVTGTKPAPNGFDLATLQADLAAVTR